MKYKERIRVSIVLPSLQAGIIFAIQEGKLNFKEHSLRDIARICGLEKESPQQVKHHLQQMVKLGILDYVSGEYCHPFIAQNDQDMNLEQQV